MKDSRRMQETNEEVNNLLTKIINGKVKVLKTGESHKDLLSLLLESFYQDQGKITIDDIIGHCKVFYFAGQETVAVLLTWAMVVLSLHPEWQVRAREEVCQVFGNEKPHWDGLNQLKIIPMILLEVLRLYPPAPTLLRFTNKDFKHGDTTLPAGVQIVIPTVLFHHSSEFWGKDVDEFKPERFSEGVAKATNNQFLFFPFGGGHQICIGQQFAMVETKLGLATILQCFAFEISPSYTHTPANIITLRPQQGVHLKLRRVSHQLHFDAFFGLLTKYCVSKYDSIVQSLLMQAPPNTAAIGAEAARAISKEMPVELLRASLPHTDDHQRKLLVDFAQRSMPVTGFNVHGGGSGGHINSESVPG
ncbi:cytochrome P450 72A397-like [Macadamia integrifolia]|uniref:cytochrome P450 72A397-like n=1 Tax=Macadamia integrifolia TaxID=60698 RepID=UPI001C52F63C|nr:cytochrome P450 72A397-like [Macadamia integrifolia]